MQPFQLQRQYGTFSDGFQQTQDNLFRQQQAEQRRAEVEQARQDQMQQWIEQQAFRREADKFSHQSAMDRDLKRHEYAMTEMAARPQPVGRGGASDPMGGMPMPTPGSREFMENPAAVDQWVKEAANRKKAAELREWELQQQENTRGDIDAQFANWESLRTKSQENSAKLARGDNRAGDILGIGGKDRRAMAQEFEKQEFEILSKLQSFATSGNVPPEISKQINREVASLPPERIVAFFEKMGIDEARLAAEMEKQVQTGAIDKDSYDRIYSAFARRR